MDMSISIKWYVQSITDSKLKEIFIVVRYADDFKIFCNYKTLKVYTKPQMVTQND